MYLHSVTDPEQMKEWATHVGNFAMMIADKARIDLSAAEEAGEKD